MSGGTVKFDESYEVATSLALTDRMFSLDLGNGKNIAIPYQLVYNLFKSMLDEVYRTKEDSYTKAEVDNLSTAGIVAIAPADADDETAGLKFPTESGTYTNYGGIVVDLSEGLVMIYSDGNGVFSKTVVPIELEGYATDEDISDMAEKTGLVVYGAGNNQLFDKGKIKDGIVDKAGNLTPAVSRCYSSFIPVKGETTYRMRSATYGEGVYNVCEYDINQNVIPNSGSDSRVSEITTKPDTRYIVITIRPDLLADFMVNEGSVLIDYEDYEEVTYIDPRVVVEKASLPSGVFVETGKNIPVEFLTFSEKVLTKNLFNKNDEDVADGYYVKGLDGSLSPNASYVATGYIPVNEGGQYTASNSAQQAYYDENKVFISGVVQSGSSSPYTYTVPVGAAFVRHSIFGGDKDSYQVEEGDEATSYEDYLAYYILKNTRAEFDRFPEGFEAEEKAELLVYLPPVIYVAVGRTIELYNTQVAWTGNFSDFHFFWSGIGKSMKRKWTLTGTTPGESTLTLKVFDKNMNLVKTATTTVKVVSATIGSAFSVLTIGDSLTNTTSTPKPWMGEVRTLAGNNINFVGTRGSAPNEYHEGRSGFTSGNYLTATAYPFEGEGTQPFWDGSRFNWSYYKTEESQNPDRVMIWLGTNGIALDPTSNAGNIKQIVDYIRQDDATIKIYVAFTLFRGNQDGIGKQTGNDGYVANTAWKLEEDRKVFNLMVKLDELLGEYSNLYFVPIATCHDSEYNFGAVSTPVNPRASQVEYLPTEATHPQAQGYLQIADIIFSVLAGT